MSEPSLREIQAAYFDGLDQIFGEPFSEMEKHDANCAEIAADLASSDRVVKAFERDADNFFGDLTEFWNRYRELVDRAVTELTCFKALYGETCRRPIHTISRLPRVFTWIPWLSQTRSSRSLGSAILDCKRVYRLSGWLP